MAACTPGAALFVQSSPLQRLVAKLFIDMPNRAPGWHCWRVVPLSGNTTSEQRGSHDTRLNVAVAAFINTPTRLPSESGLDRLVPQH